MKKCSKRLASYKGPTKPFKTVYAESLICNNSPLAILRFHRETILGIFRSCASASSASLFVARTFLKFHSCSGISSRMLAGVSAIIQGNVRCSDSSFISFQVTPCSRYLPGCSRCSSIASRSYCERSRDQASASCRSMEVSYSKKVLPTRLRAAPRGVNFH